MLQEARRVKAAQVVEGVGWAWWGQTLSQTCALGCGIAKGLTPLLALNCESYPPCLQLLHPLGIPLASHLACDQGFEVVLGPRGLKREHGPGRRVEVLPQDLNGSPR